MGSKETKELRNRRIQKRNNSIDKQSKIAGQYGLKKKSKHYYNKHHAMNCGDPTCSLCSNPRKIFNELTIQEKSFEQTGSWIDDSDQHY